MKPYMSMITLGVSDMAKSTLKTPMVIYGKSYTTLL